MLSKKKICRGFTPPPYYMTSFQDLVPEDLWFATVANQAPRGRNIKDVACKTTGKMYLDNVIYYEEVKIIPQLVGQFEFYIFL